MLTSDGGHRGLPTPPHRPIDLDEAAEFFRLHAAENPAAPEPTQRLIEVAREFGERGIFRHTSAELEFGAKVAWRNANRCIGRLYWRSLVVRDRREVRHSGEVAAECVEHLRIATNGGKIRPVLTLFAPDEPGRPAPRIRNDQLIRYAGHEIPEGVIGDPAQREFTTWVESLGWSGKGTPHDILPLAVDTPEGIAIFDIPEDAVLEVELAHPDFPWFAGLGLRWHAVPAISTMPLRIGGLTYPTAPFNGWYLGTEIGSRNLVDADRYDLLIVVAGLLGLDTSDHRSLWKDTTLVEINRAVLWSFDQAGVKISDHHTESDMFMAFLAKEEKAGRTPTAEWSWVVPPLAGSASPVYHRYYDETVNLPGFLPAADWPVPTTDWPPAQECPHQGNLPSQNDLLPSHDTPPSQNDLLPSHDTPPSQSDLPRRGDLPSQSDLPRRGDLPSQDAPASQNDLPSQSGLPRRGGLPRRDPLAHSDLFSYRRPRHGAGSSDTPPTT